MTGPFHLVWARELLHASFTLLVPLGAPSSWVSESRIIRPSSSINLRLDPRTLIMLTSRLPLLSTWTFLTLPIAV